MVKKILIGVGLVMGGILLFAAVRSGEMLVAREMVISATPETLFPYINNSQTANDWMPWKDSDPDAKMVYSGPQEGVGSKSSWDSKGNMGTGEALVVYSIPNQVVTTQLEYTKPFQMVQLAIISLTPVEGGTKVKWTVTGHQNYFFRLMGIFMNCDKMIGGEFEKGLANLKSKVEAQRGAK